MNYWNMQLHDGDADKYSREDILSYLRDGYVGMGDAWDGDKGQPDRFRDNVKPGDIVLIRHKGPLALVEVTSDVEENLTLPVWFKIIRRVSLLSEDGEALKSEFMSVPGRNWQDGLFNTSTFMLANDSPFIRFCHEKIKRKGMIDQLISLLDSNKNLVLTGAPGTGKTFTAAEVAKVLTGAITDNDPHIQFVQFHPSYDYSDFVEGIKPILQNGAVTLAVRNGIFKQFCLVATAHPREKFMFIIDEINRADLSRVFGELFFGLEPDYRGKPIITQYSYLQRQQAEDAKVPFKDFVIPANLYIIGTMNDIDRSVESMDFALRRRFAWKEVTAAESMVVLDSAGLTPEVLAEAKVRMTALNGSIATQMGGTAYQIGGAYFRKLKGYEDQPDLWAKLWNNHLRGVLAEYVRGDPQGPTKLGAMEIAYGKK